MRSVRVVDRDTDLVLANRVFVADRWWSRLRGLLGRRPLRSGEALLLSPCRSIHMLGMRYAIDLLFLDAGGRVVAAHTGVPPGLNVRGHRLGRMALELPAGTLARSGTATGHRIAFEPLH